MSVADNLVVSGVSAAETCVLSSVVIVAVGECTVEDSSLVNPGFFKEDPTGFVAQSVSCISPGASDVTFDAEDRS